MGPVAPACGLTWGAALLCRNAGMPPLAIGTLTECCSDPDVLSGEGAVCCIPGKSTLARVAHQDTCSPLVLGCVIFCTCSCLHDTLDIGLWPLPRYCQMAAGRRRCRLWGRLGGIGAAAWP